MPPKPKVAKPAAAAEKKGGRARKKTAEQAAAARREKALTAVGTIEGASPKGKEKANKDGAKKVAEDENAAKIAALPMNQVSKAHGVFVVNPTKGAEGQPALAGYLGFPDTKEMREFIVKFEAVWKSLKRQQNVGCLFPYLAA